MINKYKLFPWSIFSGLNYHDFFYLFFKYHLESFPSIFKPVRYKIIYFTCIFNRSLKCLKLHIPTLKCYIQDIIKKLVCIKECLCKIDSHVECYLKQLSEKIRCYIKRLTISIRCLLRWNSGRESTTYKLTVSLEQCKKELISSIGYKIGCLKNTELNVEELCKIISLLGEICYSVDKDISELSGIRSRIRMSESIKSEMDSFKFHLDKYIANLTNINSQINSLLGSGCLNRLNFISCGISTIICFIQSKIKEFKFSVKVVIKSSGALCCDIQQVIAIIQCEIPSLCEIEKQLSELICCLRNHICCIRNIICNVQKTKQIMERQMESMSCIKSEMEKMESSINIINFFKFSDESIINNTRESTKRLLTSGARLSNNELAKSIPNGRNRTGSELNKNENVWTLLSNMGVFESMFVLSKLYECSVDTNKMLYILRNVEHCGCVLSYKWDIDNLNRMYHIYDNYPFAHSHTHKRFHFESTMKDKGNNLCLCLVIKFQLYPSLVKCLCRLIDTDLDMLSTADRKFDKYTNSSGYETHVSQSLFLTICLFEKITRSMCNRYLCNCNKRPCECMDKYQPKGSDNDRWRFIGSEISKWFMLLYETAFMTSSSILGPFLPYWISIFCKKPNDPYYQFYIGLILFICQLIENIFEGQEDETKDSIQSLSTLKAELENVKFVKRVEERSSCKVYSTSISLWISDHHVSSRLFYPEGNCNFVFEPIKWDIYSKICCCCLKADCSKGGGDTCCALCCQGKGQGVSCPCPQATSGNTCGDCVCKNEIWATIEFIINYGVSKEEDKHYKLYEKVPNFWCLNKINECIRINVASCTINQGTAECAKAKIYCKFKWLLYKYYDMITNEIFNVHIIGLLSELKEESKRKGFVRLLYVTNNERLVSSVRNIRMYEKLYVDSKETKVNDINEGYYSYNDAYRINTNRAQGSLKYIIIKMVLILIILLMTILILGVYPYPNKQTDLPSSYIVL